MPETKPFASELTNLCIDYIYLILNRNSNNFSRLLKSDLDYFNFCFELVRDSIVNNEKLDTHQSAKTNELKLHHETNKISAKASNFKSSKKNQIPFKWG